MRPITVWDRMMIEMLYIGPKPIRVEWLDDQLFPRIGPGLWGDWEWV